jgi:hypothetical protein
MRIGPKARLQGFVVAQDKRLISSSTGWRALVAAVVTVAAIISCFFAVSAADRILDIQFAPDGAGLTNLLDTVGRPNVIHHLRWDVAFIALWVSALLLWRRW